MLHFVYYLWYILKIKDRNERERFFFFVFVFVWEELISHTVCCLNIQSFHNKIAIGLRKKHEVAKCKLRCRQNGLSPLRFDSGVALIKTGCANIQTNLAESVSVTLLKMSSCYGGQDFGSLFRLASQKSIACLRLFKPDKMEEFIELTFRLNVKKVCVCGFWVSYLVHQAFIASIIYMVLILE